MWSVNKTHSRLEKLFDTYYCRKITVAKAIFRFVCAFKVFFTRMQLNWMRHHKRQPIWKCFILKPVADTFDIQRKSSFNVVVNGALESTQHDEWKGYWKQKQTLKQEIVQCDGLVCCCRCKKPQLCGLHVVSIKLR